METDDSLSLNNEAPDFRLLLSHSRYDQIERELLKMFDERHQNSRNRGNGCTHHHNHSLERSLFDIEEDLHKILLLLVRQLEQLSINNNKNKVENVKMEIETPVKIEMEIPKSSTMATTKCSMDKDKSRKTSLHGNQQLIERSSIHPTNHSLNPSSEYSKFCLESDERFRNKFNRLQSSSNPMEKLSSSSLSLPVQHHLHYRLTKPDIDLVLNSESFQHQSHSKFIAKQQQLARLKQHNLLCNKINELHNQQEKSSNHHHHHPQQQQQQQTPQKIIKQIQSLIDELHLEHDWISK
ncbi:hypothetical protein HUG17_10466 [Dermatophagoides farinae]|nr:activating signal cointegrator 1 complex subunit 2 homolog isoform X1 [Dermatophagoides farinae]KAH7636496.1 hypothetical protein HUG17_10466 [Dermatophagoides farinae]